MRNRIHPALLLGAVLSAAVLSAREEPPALKAVAPRGLLIGVALNQAQSDGEDPVAAAIVPRHFNSVTPENLLKWEKVHPEVDRFDFPPADRFVAYAEHHGMFAVGHTLLWHQQTPAAVFTGPDGKPLTREALLARLRTHIETVAGRYRGRIKGWDVVNEAVDEDGSLRRSKWLEIIGEDYIARAFEFARKADPGAELYYNDYNLWKPAKRAGALRIVKQLKAQGLRVDGIGEQGHWLLSVPSLEEIDRMLAEIGAAGLKTHITELDVDVLPRDDGMYGADLDAKAKYRAETNVYPHGLPAEKQQELAKRYADIFRLFVKHRDTVARVTFWGVTDRTTWLHNFPVPGRVNYPLLWDREGQPKPALEAVVRVLQEAGKGRAK
jgi:endo-1,4-beta-xylanase